jgi:two-component system chemotaxis response regulator CheB
MAQSDAAATIPRSEFKSLAGRKIIVIGASAGGLEPLIKIVQALPEELPAAVFVAVHTAPNNPGILPQILARVGRLPAQMARDGDTIAAGHIYVAPADRHLLIQDGVMRVARGPKENGFRPAVDPLFRTAANVFGPKVIGVILSGGLNDGAYGSILIKRRRGVTVVQDPHEAFVPGMPQSVIENQAADHILPSNAIGALITRLSAEPVLHLVTQSKTMMDVDETDRDIADRGGDLSYDKLYQSAPSALTCPECGGALWELVDGELVRYRCHVGHGYTAESLVAEQDDALENALWAALRGLEESAELSRQMLARAREGNLQGLAQAHEQRLRLAEQRADLIRSVLVNKGERQSA